MSFNPNTHGPLQWFENQKSVLPKGAAVVAKLDNWDLPVKAFVLTSLGFGTYVVTTDPDPILHDMPLLSGTMLDKSFTVTWWQYEDMPRSEWLPTRPRSGRLLAQGAARRDADRDALP